MVCWISKEHSSGIACTCTYLLHDGILQESMIDMSAAAGATESALLRMFAPMLVMSIWVCNVIDSESTCDIAGCMPLGCSGIVM